MLRSRSFELMSQLSPCYPLRTPFRTASTITHDVSALVRSKQATLVGAERRSLEMGVPLQFGDWTSPFFVVNKPVGLPTHAHNRDSQLSRLEYIVGNNAVLHPVHRLDKYTAGAIVVATNSEAAGLQGSAMSKFSSNNSKVKDSHNMEESRTIDQYSAAATEFPQLLKETFGVTLQKRYRALLQRPRFTSQCTHGPELLVNPHITGGIAVDESGTIGTAGGVASFMQRRAWMPVEWASERATPRQDELDQTRFYHTREGVAVPDTVVSQGQQQKAPYEWMNETLQARDSLLDTSARILAGVETEAVLEAARDDLTGDNISEHHNIAQFDTLCEHKSTYWHPAQWRNMRVTVNSRTPAEWPSLRLPCGCYMGYVGYADTTPFHHQGNLPDLKNTTQPIEDRNYVDRSQPHPFIPHIVLWESVPKHVDRPISKIVPISLMRENGVESTTQNVHKQYTHSMHSTKEAQTRFRVDKVMDNHLLVSASLLTGRTHQLRVHFADSGAPIAGDIYYNPETADLWKNNVSDNSVDRSEVWGLSRLGMTDSDDGDGSILVKRVKKDGLHERKHTDPMMALQAYLLEFALPQCKVSTAKAVINPQNNAELFWRLRREMLERLALAKQSESADRSGVSGLFYNLKAQLESFHRRFTDVLTEQDRAQLSTDKERAFQINTDVTPLYSETYDKQSMPSPDQTQMHSRQKAYELLNNAKLSQKQNLNDVSSDFDELYGLEGSSVAEALQLEDIRLHSRSETNKIYQLAAELVHKLGDTLQPFDRYKLSDDITLSGDEILHQATGWSSWTYSMGGKGVVGRVVLNPHSGWHGRWSSNNEK